MSRPCKHRIVAFEGYPPKPATSAKMTGVGNQGYTEGYMKVGDLWGMPGKPLISGVHIFPIPVMLADVASLFISPPKVTTRCLQEQTSFVITVPPNLFR